MAGERLDFGNVPLADALRALGPAGLKAVAAVAAQLAVADTGLADPRLDPALAALDTGGSASQAGREAVETLIRELDEVYLTLASERDAATPASAVEFASFVRARAAHSVWFALDPDPHTAAFEAVYESVTALSGDSDKLLTALRPFLPEWR